MVIHKTEPRVNKPNRPVQLWNPQDTKTWSESQKSKNALKENVCMLIKQNTGKLEHEKSLGEQF